MTNAELVDSLRMLADFYEQRPSLPVPYELESESGMFVFFYGKEDTFKQALRTIGSYEKVFGEPSPGDFHALKTIGAFKLKFHATRETVCTPRIVGKRVVARQVVPSQPAQVIEAHDEDIVEWDCEPILSGGAR